MNNPRLHIISGDNATTLVLLTDGRVARSADSQAQGRRSMPFQALLACKLILDLNIALASGDSFGSHLTHVQVGRVKPYPN